MNQSRFRVRRLALLFAAAWLLGSPPSHAAENIGTTTIRLILVELKEHP
jgi:hypothetical protein